MAYLSEKILPYASDNEPKRKQVERMFDEIAPQYDLLNHTLSFGIDRLWRRKGISALMPLAPKTILDIATGTGDLALEACRLLKPEKVLGIDLSEKMMDAGRCKAAKAGWQGVIGFERRDSADLQLESNSFDAAMVAFGVRNFENLDKSLQEILRVLRPGGQLMILELSAPERFPMKQLYGLYSRFIPLIGNLISRHSAAYRYLPKSIEAFAQNGAMTEILQRNGYRNAWYRKLTFGICSLYLGEKAV